VVTGGAAGTGRAIAARLAAEGAEVVVADVDRAGGEAVARSIGGRFAAADMARMDDVRRLIASAQPQILVNNAGGGGHVEPHFPDAPPELWRGWMELNLLGPMLATQLALEPMRRAGGGAVVNVASTAGLGFGPYVSPEYGASKAGLIRLTSSLAGLDGGVRVNCVVPDWILTERAEAELERMSPAEREAAPVPRPPSEVADAVVALARDESLRGRVLVMWPNEPPRLLDPELRL
jgi:NAD(P)-dependent dehydrogenase (short-subunit alcohol dehydrogenase family)